jgi:hypothetical protein
VRAADGFVKRAAALNFREDDVRGGVEHTGETANLHSGQAHRKHGKNRDTVHHRRFIEKSLALLARQGRQFLERVDDRSFVGGDRVRAQLECGFDVLDGRLTGLRVERTGFEHDIGARTLEPLANIARRGLLVLSRPMIIENREGIQTVGIGKPTTAPCGYAGEAPADIVAPSQFCFLGDEQAQEGATHVAEADDREVVGGNLRPPKVPSYKPSLVVVPGAPPIG